MPRPISIRASCALLARLGRSIRRHRATAQITAPRARMELAADA